jgi:predicted nucleic acid-binding protein
VILIDTNVLVALAEPDDELYTRALADLPKFSGQNVVLTEAVLTEAVYLIAGRAPRARLRTVIDLLNPDPCSAESDRQFRSEALAWLDQYADHDPDWADAVLVVLSGRFRKSKVWTYDREFRTIWRTPAGNRIRLANA